jgi:hypothetical protein
VNLRALRLWQVCLQHAQEELVEQLVLLGGDEEGLGLVIFCLDAV